MIARFSSKMPPRHLLGLSLAVVTLSNLVGCAQFDLMKSFEGFSAAESDQYGERQQQQQRPSARCQVMIDNGWGEPKVTDIELRGPMTVTDVLKQAKAMRRYGSMDVEVLRMTPNSPRPLRLPVTYQPREQSVKVEQDYAILPNDQIRVTHTASSPLSGLLGGVTQ